MIRLDCKLDNLPTPLLAFSLDNLATIGCHIPKQNALSPLGTPNQVIHYQVYSMFIPLVFHVVILPTIDKEINRRLKPLKAA